MKGQYRRREVFSAKRWWKLGDHPSVGDEPAPSYSFYHRERCPKCGSRKRHGHVFWTSDYYGSHLVCPGDWLIIKPNGDLYHHPIKNDVFMKLYEEVE